MTSSSERLLLRGAVEPVASGGKAAVGGGSAPQIFRIRTQLGQIDHLHDGYHCNLDA